MRKLRKNLFRLSALVNIFTSVMSILVLTGLWFNTDGIKEEFLLYFESIKASQFMSQTTFIVLININLFIVILVSLFAAFVYLRQTRLNYPKFLLEKPKYKKLAIINVLLSPLIIVAPFIYLAMTLAPNEGEVMEYNIYFTEKQRESYFKNLIVSDPMLNTMGMQINLLKQKLQNNEINADEYRKMLNDILDYGVGKKNI